MNDVSARVTLRLIKQIKKLEAGKFMELPNMLTWTLVYDFIRGPMVWISFIVFIFGSIFQIFRMISLMQNQKILKLNAGPGRFISTKPSPDDKKDWLMWLKLSIAGINPFMTSITIVFHVLLIMLPFLVLGHNILLDNAFGISMVSLPENISDFLTLLVIFCTLIFLYRRMFLDRVKMITGYEDYLFLFLAAAPFITGYLAYHLVFVNYKLMITLHILSGELMLMAVPFTKFIHMIYLVIVRFTVTSEYSLGNGSGSRTW